MYDAAVSRHGIRDAASGSSLLEAPENEGHAPRLAWRNPNRIEILVHARSGVRTQWNLTYSYLRCGHLQYLRAQGTGLEILSHAAALSVFVVAEWLYLDWAPARRSRPRTTLCTLSGSRCMTFWRCKSNACYPARRPLLDPGCAKL